MKKRIFSIVMLIVLVSSLVVFSGCGKKEKTNVIKIGVILPLTGPFSAFGEEYKRSINLALENILCEKKIEIYFEDGMGDVKSSISAYKKLNLQNNPDIVISIMSNVCLALKPIIEKNNQIFFAEVSHPDMLENNNGNIFRHSQTSIQEAQIISDYLKRDNKRIFCLVPNDDYYSSLISELNKEQVIYRSFTYNKKEYTKNDIQKLINIINNEKDVLLFLGGYGSELGNIIRDSRINGYKNDIITSVSSFILPGVKEFAGDSFKNIYAPYFVLDSLDIEYSKVNQKYLNKYNRQMPIYSLLEYNTMFLIINSLNNINNFSINNVANYLINLKKLNGVGEIMIINKNGDINPKLQIIEM